MCYAYVYGRGAYYKKDVKYMCCTANALLKLYMCSTNEKNFHILIYALGGVVQQAPTIPPHKTIRCEKRKMMKMKNYVALLLQGSSGSYIH